jgi:RNA polymerase sigma factor (sigma-70 family)
MADAHSIARLAAQVHGGLADHALLERFAADRDEAAFAALVERHGVVVLDAALAVLRHAQDAEDVFQAAFLVLARKAASVRRRDALACWLHGVARRIALRALRARDRRARHEAVPRPEQVPADDLSWAEVRALVHEELARLPDHLRAAVILCHLEGLTLDDAAARLGVPRGTLRGRLDRARDLLRHRLARRGLALAALAFPASAAHALPPLVVLGTARSATQFAAGVAEHTRAAALANGVMSMTATRVKLALFFVATLGAVGLGLAATQEPDPTPTAVAPATAPRNDEQPPPAADKQPPAAAPKAEFDEVTIVIKHSFLSNRTRETIRVSADGTCGYEVPERPARGNIPAWSGARIVHKLPPERLRQLNDILKETDWLAKDAKAVMQLHQEEYELTLKRGGKTTDLAFKGQSQPYAKLLHFFRSVAAQEYIIYRLDWVPSAHAEGRHELDNLVVTELGEQSAKPLLDIDLARFVPWATRYVRNPFGEPTDDVRTAVRLVGLLKLESERGYLADLATDRDRDVRVAVAEAVGRLGGEKAVPVLRKMVRSTGTEAAWELIKLGEIAVPAIAEAIREETDPNQDRSAEWLIRAYIENWKRVRKPLDAGVLDAVRANMAAPKVKADRTQYHIELLKLAAEPPAAEGGAVRGTRVSVRNLALAAEAYKRKTGAYPQSLATLQVAGFLDPKAVLRDPWGKDFRYDPKGPRSGGKSPDIWVVTPDGLEVGSWAAELWGVWVVKSAAADEKPQQPSGGSWEFGAGGVKMSKSGGEVYRNSTYSVDASKEPKQIDISFGTAPKTLKGIYEVKGDTLRVCESLEPDERPKDFGGGPGRVVWVFERQKD